MSEVDLAVPPQFSAEYLWVNQIHQDAEARLPLGWEGLIEFEIPQTLAEIGPWMRRELGCLLIPASPRLEQAGDVRRPAIGAHGRSIRRSTDGVEARAGCIP